MEFYRQSNPFTGAACCLLMILHNKNPDIKLTKDEEFRIWMRSANLPTRSSSIYALATIAKQQGHDVTLYVEKTDFSYPDYRFKRYKKSEIEDAAYTSNLYKIEAEKQGVRIIKKKITIDDIKQYLLNNSFLILRINAGIIRHTKSTSKYVVITGYEDKYHVIDPEQGELLIAEEELLEAINTLKTKKRRDTKMLVIN